MNGNILDIMGLLIIFIALLYIGYRSSKKVQSSEDFFIAGRGLNKIQAGFSLFATEFGGASLVGAAAYCYMNGISGAWWDWSAAPAFLLLSTFVSKKLRPLSLNTAPEFMEKRYSFENRALSAVLYMFKAIPVLGAQFTISSFALSVILGINPLVGLIISTALVILYTAGGGLLAVVNTDVFQFVILFITVILVVVMGIVNVGGITTLISSAPTNYFDLTGIGYKTILAWSILGFTAYSTDQTYLQRVFAAENERTARFAYNFTGIAYLVLGTMVGVIGLIMLILLPELEDPNIGFHLLIKQLMPKGLAGLCLGGIFAATMSTADSILLATTTIFVNDLYVPILTLKGNKIDDRKILLFSRIFTVIICILAVIASLLMEGILDMVFIAGLFYYSAIFFPMILGAIWKRGNAKGAFSSMIISVIIGVFSHFYLQRNYSTGILSWPSNILGLFASAISYIIISLLTERPRKENIEFLENRG
ncbi:MAG: sodium:solute symporter family protein [Acidaminococcaceae bacterium]|nr:sodium:solute symporter family protein [Acidaminococcaceae bacterium]